MWQSAWAPSGEWQGLAVNANGREQLTEKRIIISLHYIYTACLSVSLSSSGPRREQQSVLAMLYLPVLQKTNIGVTASGTQGSKEFLTLTICHGHLTAHEQQRVFGSRHMSTAEQSMEDIIFSFLISVEVYSEHSKTMNFVIRADWGSKISCS